MSFLVIFKQISYYTYFCNQIEGEIRFYGSRLSPCSLSVWWLNENLILKKKKKKKNLKIGIFFKIGKKSHLNSIGNWAENPENTYKNPCYIII